MNNYINEEDLKSNRRFPWLILGDAVTDFKKAYRGSISRLSNIEEIKDFVGYYSRVLNLNRLLVIEDISFIKDAARSMLLKFIEETPLQLVILGIYDGVDPVLLSRIKRVDKYTKNKIESKFLGAKEGYETVETLDDEHYYTWLKDISLESPMLYYYYVKVKNPRHIAKLLGILK